MSMTLIADRSPVWTRESRTEFNRSKKGPDGSLQQTRWSFTFEEKSLLGLGQEAYVFFLRAQDALLKPKAIKVSLGSRPLMSEFNLVRSIKESLGKESTGLHLAIHAHFNKDKHLSIDGYCVTQTLMEECLIMRKYDYTLAKALPNLSNAEKIRAFMQLAEGLSSLHRLGIIHGDIQLNNMMYDASKQQWRLIDITPSSKETMADDVKYLILSITLVLIEEGDRNLPEDALQKIAHLGELESPSADQVYEILKEIDSLVKIDGV